MPHCEVCMAPRLPAPLCLGLPAPSLSRERCLGRPRDLPAAGCGTPGFIKADQGCLVSPMSWGRGHPWVQRAPVG